MILVDVYVPSLDQTYDFQLDETGTVRQITRVLAELLCRKSGSRADEEGTGRFVLCSSEPGRILPPDLTLAACGIDSGSRLFIV